MTYIKWISLIIFFGCIDIITRTHEFNSLYFQGGSWIEYPQMEAMKMEANENDFTIQFWVSGSEIDINEAPSLFSIIDSNENIKLALLTDKGQPNSTTLIINNNSYSFTNASINWANPNNFYLLSFLFSNDKNMKVFINDTKIENVINNTSLISVNDAKLISGAFANSNYNILENFWYGYIDEIRLWNTWLADSTIAFHSKHPNKLGESYRYTENNIEIETHLDSLIGLWRFNFLEANSLITDESKNGNDGIIYTLPNFIVELSQNGVQ